MRRAASILTVLAALSGGAPAAAQEPRLAANLAACETGASAADRYAVFSGAMPREGAVTMAMRFDLYERRPGRGFERVALANWGVWERTAKKKVPGFIFTKRLEQLDAPAAFRAVVSFRWHDAKGRVVRTAKRTSPTCRQPDWRADLTVRRVILSTDGGPTRVVVENTGRGAAGAFAVNAARADVVKGATVAGLLAGAQAMIGVPLGRCRPGQTVTVELDSSGAVEETDEADNAVTVACPA